MWSCGTVARRRDDGQVRDMEHSMCEYVRSVHLQQLDNQLLLSGAREERYDAQGLAGALFCRVVVTPVVCIWCASQ